MPVRTDTPKANKCQRIAVGFKMKEGLTCMAVNTTDKVVLAVHKGAFEPYVTWKYGYDQESQQYVFWSGHYFQEIVNAAIDFRDRR